VGRRFGELFAVPALVGAVTVSDVVDPACWPHAVTPASINITTTCRKIIARC
jgi:hypothetical protein